MKLLNSWIICNLKLLHLDLVVVKMTCWEEHQLIIHYQHPVLRCKIMITCLFFPINVSVEASIKYVLYMSHLIQ
ncbi:unnamed protein product [Schistosoma curassoni]|uniref:Ovule protein n=1 Tax=Schistosoma curassoni TaxID=6186 RepID=A0A183JQB7_9TREM|nr:unnamed protein product [Schistosoma curassoni]